MRKIHNFLVQNNAPYSKWHSHPHSTLFNFLLLTICSSLIAGSLTYTINQTVNAYDEAAAQEQYALAQQGKSNIPEKTKDLLNLVYQHNKAELTEKPGLLLKLVRLASERQDALTKAMDKNPQEVLDNVINPSLTKNMPEDIKSFIEEKKTIKGRFSHVHMDFFEQDFSVEEYYIEDSSTKERYKVHFSGDVVKAKTDDTVSISGVVLGKNIAASTEDTQILSTPVASSSVSKKSIVIMFNWQNDTRTTFTEASARAAFFTNTNSANGYFKENSFGKMDLVGKVRPDGDVYGWYTIPYDNTNCSSNWDVWDDAADAKAKAAGVDLSGYDTKTYVFPYNSSCGWSGLGYMGGAPARSWINGTSVSTITHELGHNIGTHHASSYSCTDNGARVSISNNCTASEYGDPYDVMGASGSRHMNVYHKGENGTYSPNWLSTSNTLTIDRKMSPDANYLIAPLEQGTSSVQSLRIPRTVSSTGSVSDYYYLEFRQPFGFDNFASTSAAVNGVMIRIAPNYNVNTQSKLIDATPETTSFTDAPLPVGRTFNDPYNAISVSTLSVGPSGANVRVSFGTKPCTNTTPSTSITPTTQSGGAGQTISYNIVIKNNDPIDCDPSDFSITPTLPSGFAQSPTSLTTGLLSPGSSITKTVNITSPTSATGNNNFTEKTTNKTNTSLTSSASGVYSIITPDTIVPTVSITKPQNGSTVPKKGSLSIGVTASDDQGISKIEIYLDSSIIKTCSNTTSCSVNYKVNSLSSGVHTLTAKAYDPSGNVSLASVVVTK